MPALMSDHDIEGQFEHLRRLILADEWRSIWEELNFQFESFESLGLASNTSDELIWMICQEKGLSW